MTEPTPGFLHEPDPDHPGWLRWGFKDPTRFNALLGKMIVRREEGGRVRMRTFPDRSHSNLGDKVHGGALLGYIDVALFAVSRTHGLIDAGTAVTLDLTTQFIGAADFDRELDVVGEVLRATRRLIFIRGLVEQGDALIASFSGTVRRPSAA
jgi:acyl-coenzyme A thioesterase PaaI-like protein